MHDPLSVAIFTVVGYTGEFHPRRDARSGGLLGGPLGRTGLAPIPRQSGTLRGGLQAGASGVGGGDDATTL